MAKEPIDLSLKTKIILWGITVVFGGGVTYALIINNAKGVSDNQSTMKKDRAKAESSVKEIDVKLETHKEKNRETERMQALKHEQIKERLHQNELMVQRQLTVSESLATGQSEAKQERKEDRAEQRKYQDKTGEALIKMMESQIKLEAKLNEWEPDNGKTP